MEVDQAHSAVRTTLARAIATRDLPDDIVKSVAERLVDLSVDSPIRRFDVCSHGICVDYLVEIDRWKDILLQIADKGRFHEIKLFPWGILQDDLMQIQVEHEVPELAPFVKELGGL